MLTQEEYRQITNFLDAMPELDMPWDLHEFSAESTVLVTTQNISDIHDGADKACDDPDKVLEDN